MIVIMRSLLSLDLRVLFLMSLAKCSLAGRQAKQTSHVAISVHSMASAARKNVSSPATEGSNSASPPKEDVLKYYKSHDGCASEAEVENEALCKKLAGSMWSSWKINVLEGANYPKGCYWDPHATNYASRAKGVIKFNDQEGKFPEGKDYQAICLGEFTYWYYWPEVEEPADFKPREAPGIDAAELTGMTIRPFSRVKVVQKQEKGSVLYLKLAGKQGGWCIYNIKDPGSKFLQVPKWYTPPPLVEKGQNLDDIKPCKPLTKEQCQMIALSEERIFFSINNAEYPKECFLEKQNFGSELLPQIFWHVYWNDAEGKANDDFPSICLED